MYQFYYARKKNVSCKMQKSSLINIQQKLCTPILLHALSVFSVLVLFDNDIKTYCRMQATVHRNSLMSVCWHHPIHSSFHQSELSMTGSNCVATVELHHTVQVSVALTYAYHIYIERYVQLYHTSCGSLIFLFCLFSIRFERQ